MADASWSDFQNEVVTFIDGGIGKKAKIYVCSNSKPSNTGEKEMLFADEEQLARIGKVPKREFMRRGINQHTLEKICRREPVRAIKLQRCLNALEEYEQERAS